jgi:hypothetical protein
VTATKCNDWIKIFLRLLDQFDVLRYGSKNLVPIL